MGPCRMRIGAVAALLAALAGPAVGQELPNAHQVLDEARSAQRRFERVRRRYLPATLGGWGGSCDERVGRFCFWHEDDPSWEPQPEDARVTDARDRLLAELSAAADLLPADEWIVGQRVRYLIEAERLAEALAVARDCGAAPWWCRLLEGYARHTRGEFAAADSVFAAALSESPEALRCEWTDLSMLLDGDLEPSYRRTSCADRAPANRRLWWLADPLYLVPGNERRTEHFARQVVDRLMRDADTPYGMRWGGDNHELTVRYGATVAWERRDPGSSSLSTRPEVIGHHAPGSKHFFPPRDYVAEPSRITPGAWDLEPYRPRTRYAPWYARAFGRLEPQVAVFRRDDSLLVVVAVEVEALRHERADAQADRAPAPRAHEVEVGVILARDERATPAVARMLEPGPCARLVARTPDASFLLSVEALDRSDSVAARERHWISREPDAAGFGLSDILLIDADSLPDGLEAAAPLARPSAVFRPGEIIQVYWEVYGVPSGTPDVVSITVTRQGGSFFRRAAQFLGLAGRDDSPVRLEWADPPNGGRRGAGRSVSLQLPGERDGRYTIRLEAALPSGARAATTKQILVEEP